MPLAGLGLYFLTCKNTRKYGVILLLWSILMTVFVLKVYFPLLSEKGYWHYGRYELLAPTVEGTMQNMWTMLQRLFRAPSGTVLLTLLCPFAFLPVVHLRMFVLVLVPTLGIQLVSASEHQNFLSSHYSSALIGVVPLAVLWGIRVLQKWAWKRHWLTARNCRIAAVFLLVTVCGYHICCCDLPLVRYHDYIIKWESKYHYGILSLPLRPAYYQLMLDLDARGEALRKVLAQIPAGSHVVCQNELGSPLLRTHKISDMPGPDDADFYLWESTLYSGADDLGILRKRIRSCQQDPDMKLLYYDNSILLYGRKKGSGK